MFLRSERWDARIILYNLMLKSFRWFMSSHLIASVDLEAGLVCGPLRRGEDVASGTFSSSFAHSMHGFDKSKQNNADSVARIPKLAE